MFYLIFTNLRTRKNRQWRPKCWSRWIILCMQGDIIVSTLCWMPLLSASRIVSSSRKDMGRIFDSKLWGDKSLDSIYYSLVLVCHYHDNRWIWWSPCSQHHGNGFHNILHALQPWPHCLSHWQHDKLSCWRNLPDHGICKCSFVSYLYNQFSSCGYLNLELEFEWNIWLWYVEE